MKYRNLGNSDIEASVIAMGAWAIGGGASWGAKVEDETAMDTVRAAFDAGINFFDTAPAYGFGHSEKLLGQVISGQRDKFVIATKCGLWWDDKRGSFFTEFEGRPIYRSLRPDTIAIEVERSLRNLKTDYIDLYQTHWPAVEPDKTPISTTMEILLKLVEDGKIRAIGVSNVAPDELKTWLKCGPIVSDQFRYSMLYRQPEEDILPLCEENGLSTLTYMSLEQGLLTGKVKMDTVFEEGDFRTNTAWNAWYLPNNRRRILDLMDNWGALCNKHSCNLAQLVLAWTLTRPGVTHILAGARKVEQIQQNAAAADIQLDNETLEQMKQNLQDLGDPQPE